MTRSHLAIVALVCLAGCQFGQPRQSPEEFATTAIRAVAMNDFGGYLPLCAQGSRAVAAQGAKSMSETLGAMETAQIRANFDRVVGANRLRPTALDSYQPKLRAEEHERWIFDVLDGSGTEVGVQLVIRRAGDDYRVVGLNLL